MCTHSLCVEQKYENNRKNQLKIVIFTAVKNGCMLHGCVFIMYALFEENIKWWSHL